MGERTIRRKAREKGYRLQRYQEHILIIDMEYNCIVRWCSSLKDASECLDLL